MKRSARTRTAAAVRRSPSTRMSRASHRSAWSREGRACAHLCDVIAPRGECIVLEDAVALVDDLDASLQMENSPLKVYIAVQHAEHLTGSQSCVQHEDVCTCLPVELLSCRVSFGCLGFQSLCRFYVSISNVSSVGFGASPEKMRPGSCRQRRWKSGRSACHTNWSSAESFTCDILIAPSLMAYFTTLHKIF